MGWSPGGRSAGFMVVVVATSSVVALTTIILWKLNGSNSYVSKNCCSKQAMKQKRRYAGAGDAGDAGDAGSSVIWLYGTSDGSKNMILIMMKLW